MSFARQLPSGSFSNINQRDLFQATQTEFRPPHLMHQKSSSQLKDSETKFFKNSTVVGAMKYQSVDNPIKISVVKKAKPPLNRKKHPRKAEDSFQ